MEAKKVTHELEPIYNEKSEVLILGSIPSIKSREVKFYYGHPKNRFWQVLENIFEAKIEDKKTFLLDNHIAIWDVLKECTITGSSDSSIKEPIPNDLENIIKSSNIKAIFTTGKSAHKYYQKFFGNKITIPEINLPSTSPANATLKIEDLTKSYKIIKEILKNKRQGD